MLLPSNSLCSQLLKICHRKRLKHDVCCYLSFLRNYWCIIISYRENSKMHNDYCTTRYYFKQNSRSVDLKKVKSHRLSRPCLLRNNQYFLSIYDMQLYIWDQTCVLFQMQVYNAEMLHIFTFKYSMIHYPTGCLLKK